MKKISNYILEQVKDGNINKNVAVDMLEMIVRDEDNQLSTFNYEDIAIIGVACRLPDADSVEEFAQNLLNAKDSVTYFPSERIKDVEKVISDRIDVDISDIHYMQGAYLKNIDMFDNEIFGITPGEAALMDPQQRIFLEVAYNTFYNAGYGKDDLKNSNIGIFVGASEPQYKEMISFEEPSAFPGNLPSVVASRVAYVFNLKGPTEVIDTTCSSSLVALHNGCLAIQNGDCEMALIGGVKLNLYPVEMEKYGIRTEAKDYRCKAFDESADGIGLGEGAVAIMIKPLSKAEEDNDYVYAVIKGSAVNSCGKTNGITAPDADAQSKAIISAWKRADISPDSIGYIETHGAGTKLGDSIEIQGLNLAVNNYSADCRRSIPIGSVKTNIGHLDSAAGIAGLIKVIAMMQYRKIPVSLHIKNVNPLLELDKTPFFVNQEVKVWDVNRFKNAVISSFGLSGTNAHVVLEYYPNQVELPRYNTQTELFKRKHYWVDYTSKHTPKLVQKKDIYSNVFEYIFRYGENIIESIYKEVNDNVSQDLEMFSAVFCNKVFRRLGAFDGFEEFTLDEFVNKCNIVPEYVKLCRFMLSLLVDNGILKFFNERYIYDKEYNSEEIFDSIKLAYINNDDYKDIFKLLIDIEKDYDKVLMGVVNPLTLLYPKGNQNYIQSLKLETGRFSEAYSIMSLEAIQKYVSTICDRKIKILEVGGGNGSFTHHILPRLKNYDVEYHFTDIGNYFILNAEKNFSEFPFVKCFKYDIEKNPMEQGIEIDSYDIILGLNVVHATSNIRKVIKSITQLLKKDGILALMEDVMNSNWTTLVWGITEGWWIFEDYDLRLHTPLLTDENWEKIFNENFNNVLVFPESKSRRKLTENILIIGKKEDQIDDLDKDKDIEMLPFYNLEWVLHDIDTKSNKHENDSNANWIVFEDNIAIGSKLSKILNDNGANVIVFKKGDEYKKVNDNLYYINVNQLDQLTDVFEYINKYLATPLRGIIHMWSCNNTSEEQELLVENISYKQQIGLYSIFSCIKNVEKINHEKQIELFVIANNVDSITQNEANMYPEKATMHGFCRAIPQEYPRVSCYFIDIDLNNTDSIANDIYQEMGYNRDEYSVGYRNGRRYVQQVNKLPYENFETRTHSFRENGTYVIAGGAGYLGLRCCYSIAKKVKAKFILINRTQLPPEEEWDKLLPTLDPNSKLYYQILNFKTIKDLGSEIILYSVDICKYSSLELIIKEVKEKYNKINGVINAMMIINLKKIEKLSLAELKNAVESKICGMLNLDKVFENEDLDFFALCSSITSIFAGINRADCAASNMFMDLYGAFLRKSGREVTVLNLPGISESKSDKNGVALPEISIDEFGKFFVDIISKKIGHVMIEDFNFDEIKKIHQLIRFKFDDKLFVNSATLTKKEFSKEEHIDISKISKDELLEKVNKIWSDVLGIESIDNNADFFEIGGDSLLAIKLNDSINETFALSMEVSNIFSYSTVDELTKFIISGNANNNDSSSSNENNIEDDPLMLLLKEMENGNN